MAVTRLQFEEQLEKLRNRLLEMGRPADGMVGDAVRALDGRHVGLAERVIASDDEIDEQDIQIESECMRLIAPS